MATVIDAVREKTGRRTARAAQSANSGQLHVQPGDISFRCPSPHVVRIEVAIGNAGMSESLPAVLRLESAVLGAFVPWHPLTSLAVPSLSPGATTVVAAEVPRSRVERLGDFGNLPPRRLLTALDLYDSDDAWNAQASSHRRREPGGGLAPDLLGLMGRATVHWAGNLNVFIGARPVERHAVQALRVYPGRTNLAMFCVGSGKDAYAFHIKCTDPRWECALYDARPCRRSFIECLDSGQRVTPSEWIETSCMAVIVLAIAPPEDCQDGRIEVHVGQRSTGRSAVVEFSMDARAEGPGCFVV